MPRQNAGKTDTFLVTLLPTRVEPLFVRPLTPAEAAAFHAASAVLLEGERTFHAIQMVVANEREFHRQMAASLAEYNSRGFR